MEQQEGEHGDSSTKPPAWDKLRVQVTSINRAATGFTGGSCSDILGKQFYMLLGFYCFGLIDLYHIAHTLRALLPDVENHWDRHERCELFWPSLEYIKTSRRFPFKYRE